MRLGGVKSSRLFFFIAFYLLSMRFRSISIEIFGLNENKAASTNLSQQEDGNTFNFEKTRVVTTLNSTVRCCVLFRGVESEAGNTWFLKSKADTGYTSWGIFNKSFHCREDISQIYEHLGI